MSGESKRLERPHDDYIIPLPSVFRLQASACRDLGSALSATLLDFADDDIDPSAPSAEIFSRWPQARFGDLLGSSHLPCSSTGTRTTGTESGDPPPECWWCRAQARRLGTGGTCVRRGARGQSRRDNRPCRYRLPTTPLPTTRSPGEASLRELATSRGFRRDPRWWAIRPTGLESPTAHRSRRYRRVGWSGSRLAPERGSRRRRTRSRGGQQADRRHQESGAARCRVRSLRALHGLRPRPRIPRLRFVLRVATTGPVPDGSGVE